jgi:hypothetical protein
MNLNIAILKLLKKTLILYTIALAMDDTITFLARLLIEMEMYLAASL